jgi:thioredoxin reductase
LPQTLATHTQTHRSFTPFAGKSVVIVGSGQSGLESAALLHEVGADVELIVRGSVIWIDRKLYSYTGPAKHIFYPASDVGPPGLNWLIAFPLIFSQFSDKARYLINKRAVRPAGAQWLRSRVEGHVRISLHTQITKVIPQGQRLCLELSDGTVREVDHLFLGTGYKPDINKISFIDQELRQKVQVRNGYPALNRWFESSVPHLYFAGAIAGYTFGPICRFVAGSKVPAQQIALHAVHTS